MLVIVNITFHLINLLIQYLLENSWLSKITKIAEIKGNINEVEIFPKNELEWWFVPIKTGKFNDLFCYLKDKKSGKSHAEMGMTGTIIIE